MSGGGEVSLLCGWVMHVNLQSLRGCPRESGAGYARNGMLLPTHRASCSVSWMTSTCGFLNAMDQPHSVHLCEHTAIDHQRRWSCQFWEQARTPADNVHYT
jgi:hypothetical protein